MLSFSFTVVSKISEQIQRGRLAADDAAAASVKLGEAFPLSQYYHRRLVLCADVDATETRPAYRLNEAPCFAASGRVRNSLGHVSPEHCHTFRTSYDQRDHVRAAW